MSTEAKGTAAQTLASFVQTVAAETSVPGGGSVAAVAGALSAALGAMACRFTVGREKFRESEAEAAGAYHDGDERQEFQQQAPAPAASRSPAGPPDPAGNPRPRHL